MYRLSSDEIFLILKELVNRTKSALADPLLEGQFIKDYRTTPQAMYDYLRDEIEPVWIEARKVERTHKRK